jgi:hypothetical protein
MSVKKAQRLLLHPSEEGQSDVLHDMLPCELQQVILSIAETQGDHQEEDKGTGDQSYSADIIASYAKPLLRRKLL